MRYPTKCIKKYGGSNDQPKADAGGEVVASVYTYLQLRLFLQGPQFISSPIVLFHANFRCFLV